MIRTAWVLYGKFNTIVKTALWFICTGKRVVGLDVISMARIYVHNFTEFMVRLNGSAAARGQVAVLDTVADLYRTSIQQVQSVLGLVEHATEMLSEEDKYNATNRIILQELEALNFFTKISVLKIAVGKQNELVSLLQNISESVGNMSEHADGNPFVNFIASGLIWRFLNVQYWTELLEDETKVLVSFQTQLYEAQYWQFLKSKVFPVIVAIFLVVGITGNGLLLAIFVRHKETRTIPNSMLINLTAVDCVQLVINVLLDYLRLLALLKFGLFGCKLFFFFSFLLLTVSTYSVAMISVQRFVAVRQLPSFAWYYQSQKTKYVLIAIVWCIGLILSVPHAAAAYGENELCNEVSPGSASTIRTIDLITLCVVPLPITAVFSGLTAYRIRRSAREIPGEATGQDQLKHSRMVSSRVLFALTVLFVVSYMPDFLLAFLTCVFDINKSFMEFHWISIGVNYLKFVNCCSNPIILFVLSKRFRVYIKRYCGQREVQEAITMKAA